MSAPAPLPQWLIGVIIGAAVLSLLWTGAILLKNN